MNHLKLYKLNNFYYLKVAEETEPVEGIEIICYAKKYDNCLHIYFKKKPGIFPGINFGRVKEIVKDCNSIFLSMNNNINTKGIRIRFLVPFQFGETLCK